MVDLSASVPNAVFQELFEHSPACLALFEASDPFKVLVHNRAFQQVMDPPFSSTGVIGKTLPEFATNPDAVLQVFRQVAETGEPFVIDNYRYDGLDRGPTWWNWSLTPVYRDGVLTSLALTSVEVTEAVQAQKRIERETQARQEAERQLAGEQELLKRIIDIIPVMITVYDTKRQLLLLNGEFERLSGWSTEDAATHDIFEACYPDPDYREEVSRFMAKCEGWKDIQMTLRDGSVLETSWANVRLSDDRQVGIGLDLTDRRAAERSLEASRRELAEERAFLEAVIEIAPIGISVARDPQSRPPIINAEARQMIGRRDLVGGLERYSALPLKHLDGRPYAHDDLAIIRAMREGSETTNREVIYEGDEGSRRWLVNARPIKSEGGEIVAAIASFLDIEDRRRAEEARELLVDELNHRVKNTLAIVQSIALQSFKDLSDLSEAQRKFQARLRALAASHDLLTRENWSKAMLSDVVKTCLSACGIILEADGPVSFEAEIDQELEPKAAVSLSMALHELTTNAIKHGALASKEGRLSIRCLPDPVHRGHIRVEWKEAVPADRPPKSSPGFGMRLLRSTIERELQGHLSFDHRPDAYHCHMSLPQRGPKEMPHETA